MLSFVLALVAGCDRDSYLRVTLHSATPLQLTAVDVRVDNAGASTTARIGMPLQLPPVVGDANPPELDNAHNWRSLRDRITKRKKGAPTMAVITPIGSSAGETKVLAAASASIRKAAPSRNDMGRTTR